LLNRIRIGEIVNVHGVKGALKVLPLTDNPIRFCSLTEVELVPKRRSGGNPKTYKVLSAVPSGNMVLLRLYGIDDRNKAELLRGMFLEIPREKAVKLPKDTYFIGDLIGCSVKEEDGALLGTLTEVQSTGANDIYEITGTDHKTIWIPAIADVIKAVDVEKGEITVSLLPGLREVYEENGGAESGEE
jgi:16S rRNA processing protein rimM